MGLAVFLAMSSVVATNAVKEMGTFSAGVARGVLSTGRAGIGWTIYSEMTCLLTFEALFQCETL